MNCWFSEVCSDSKNDQSCNRGCEIYSRMLTRLNCSNIPQACWKRIQVSTSKDIKSFTRLTEIKENIFEWVRGGNNLVIYSDICGNGKTSWALKLLLAYLSVNAETPGRDCLGVFINIPELFDRERMMMNNRDEDFVSIRQNLLDCDLVVWDDIACGVLTEYQRMTLLNFISARELSRKSNIFTTNYQDEKDYLDKYIGERLSSRIWQLSEKVKFVGNSLRGV